MEKILVIDFGSQTSHLIARRIRTVGVFSEIVEPSRAMDFNGVKGIIFSGSPYSVYEKNAPTIGKSVFGLSLPILGLCFGHQLLGQMLGGRAGKGKREFGRAELEIKNHQLLFDGFGEKEIVWMSHGDIVEKLPKGFQVIASTKECENAAIADFARKIFGLQFHPEVSHTKNGLKILENFVVKVCNCKREWTMGKYVGEKQREIVKAVGNKNVFMLVSGGVDSTVALALLSKALGRERIAALHVDTGFLRENESKKIMDKINSLGFCELHFVNASKEFFSALKGVIDPEEKRRIIGETFIEVQKKEFEKIGFSTNEWLLGQGTIYPDTIETAGTRYAAKIKTHHNRIPAIKEMIQEGRLIEPLSQLYKDEVRELGKELGIEKILLERQPFPGPGLAIRALCSDGRQEELSTLNLKANDCIRGYNFIARLLPVKSVGVQGDYRSYAHPCLLTGFLDWEEIEKASTRLTNEIREINRVLFAIEPKRIERISCKRAFLTKERIERLRQADSIAMQAIEEHSLAEKIWQFPVVLLPIEVNGRGEAIVLRPIESREAMTARFHSLPEEILKEISEKILKVPGINAVFFDATHKPPATIEWE